MRCVIDTSVLVDYMLLGSERHDRAAEALKKVGDGMVPAVVLQELAFVLWRLKVDKKTINRKLEESIMSYDVAGVAEEDIVEAMAVMMKEKEAQFRRLNDKVILSIAKKNDASLLTFDDELKGECREHGIKLLE